MSRLAHRVRRQGSDHQQAQAARRPVSAQSPHPAAPTAASAPVSGGQASPEGAAVMPQAVVLVYPMPGGDYSTIAYRGLAPIFTASGEAIPADAPGRWGQLVAAGTVRPGRMRAMRGPA